MANFPPSPRWGKFGIGSNEVRTVVLGNSIVWYGYDSGTLTSKPFNAVTSRSWYDYANALLGQKLRILNRAGVSGNRLDQMRDRFATDVAPYHPNLVILEGCSNDYDQGYSAAQIFPVLMQLYAQCKAIGATLLYVGSAGMSRTNSGPPVSPTDSVQYNESQEIAQHYTLCRKAAQLLPGFMYIDMAQAMRDYTASTSNTGYGAVLANTSGDGTHPTPYGSILLGSAIATALSPFLSVAAPDRASLNGYGAAGDQSCLIGNPLMMGTSGTAGTGNTGTVPDNLSCSHTGSIVATGMSTIARTDGGPGKQFLIPLSGSAATTDTFTISASGNYSKAAGLDSFMQAAVKVVSVTSGTLLNVIANLQFTDSGFSLLSQTFFGRPHTSWSSDTLLGLTGTFDFGLQRTPMLTVPVGAAHAALTLKITTSVGAQLTLGITDLDCRIDTASSVVAAYL